MVRVSHGSRAVLLVAVASFSSCKRPDPWEKGKRVFHMGLRGSVGTLDPVRASNQFVSQATGAVYETLVEYDYDARPLELVPLLLAKMPQVSEDLRTYRFELAKGVRFHDDPCFDRAVGRELTAKDVIFSIKRMANPALKPTGWWIYNDRIVGLDDYKKQQADRPKGTAFDYDAPVEGLRVLGEHTFEIELVNPYPQFLYVLAMAYTAVVPREAQERYGLEIARHPVGTGPFRLKEWLPGTKLVFERNEHYRQDVSLDALVMHEFEQEQPMWLKFRVGDIDFVQTPAEYQPSIFDAEWNLRPRFLKEELGYFQYNVVDLVYKGFDMEHPITGGFGRGKLVRQAISLAIDNREIGDAFYNDAIVVYDGPIPPGLAGHDEKKISPYRGPNLEKARALLAAAGYPNGENLPPIQYHTNRTTGSIEQVEMLRRQLSKIGVELAGNFHSFPELDSKIKKKQCQMFGLAWVADYPDAENFLALFYGPNASPGANAFNYENPEYDALYEKSRLMSPSPERTAIYERMRDLVIEDVPMVGGFSRKRFYLWNPRVENIRPDETWYTWIRHVRVKPR